MLFYISLFTNVLSAKKYRHKLQKSYTLHFCMKKLFVKCWWNWHHAVSTCWKSAWRNQSSRASLIWINFFYSIFQTFAKEVILLRKSNYSRRSGCFVKVGERFFAAVAFAAVVVDGVVVAVRKVFESPIVIPDVVSPVAAVAIVAAFTVAG